MKSGKKSKRLVFVEMLYSYFQISNDDTDESLEVENILDDLNHSDDVCSDTFRIADQKSFEDEDFPSYKTVVLDNSPLNCKTFRGR